MEGSGFGKLRARLSPLMYIYVDGQFYSAFDLVYNELRRKIKERKTILDQQVVRYILVVDLGLDFALKDARSLSSKDSIVGNRRL